MAEAALVADPAAVAEAATTLEGAFGFAAGAAASGALAEAGTALLVVAMAEVAGESLRRAVPASRNS